MDYIIHLECTLCVMFVQCFELWGRHFTNFRFVAGLRDIEIQTITYEMLGSVTDNFNNELLEKGWWQNDKLA